MTRIEPRMDGGLVATTLAHTGDTLHWLGKRFGGSGRGHVTRRVLEIWRQGGRSRLRDHLLAEQAAARRDLRYRRWMAEVEPGLLAQVAVDDELIRRGPSFTIIVPVHNTDPAMLCACVESVLDQTYAKWSLVLVDDGSRRAEAIEVLRELSRRDDRISVVRRGAQGGISEATNAGLEVATGEFVALLDHDDTLSDHALVAMAARIAAEPGVRVLYSDEDKIDEQGRRHTPVFKPALSPHHLFTSNYCCHLLVVRADLMRELGGLRTEFNGAQDYDLVLRCLEREAPFAHLPLVLYHWRTHRDSTSGAGRAKPYAAEAGRRALAAFTEHCGVDATIEHSPFLLSYRARPAVTVDDQVQVVRTRSDGGVVEHDWSDAQRDGGSRWVLFLSEEIAGISGEQVRALVQAAKLPRSGAVGGVVMTADGRIDDAGWLIDAQGRARARYRGTHAANPGAGWALRLPRNVSFVGPQCLLVERVQLQRLPGDSDSLVPWFIRLAMAMRRQGRVAQVVGEVQVRRTRPGMSAIAPQRGLEPDGLLSDHLQYVEPQYAPLESDDSGAAAPLVEGEGRCAASSA